MSHIANTLRINHPPELSQHRAVPTVDPKTGAVSWTIEVVYRDLDGDPPSTPHLVFPDPSEPDNAAKSLVLVMQGSSVGLQRCATACIGDRPHRGRVQADANTTSRSPITGRTRRTPSWRDDTLLDVDPNNPTGPEAVLHSKPFLPMSGRTPRIPQGAGVR